MKKSAKNIHKGVGSILTAGIVSSVVLFSPSTMADSITKALTEGKAKVDVRVRLETNDVEGGKDAATALTARTRVGYETGKFSGIQAYVEFEDTMALIDEYTPEDTKYDVVADPEGTEMNQGYLAYTGVDKLLIKAGRQRVILDNARFVGNVGWRQNEQTYDAALLQTTAIPELTASYAYVNQVNGILYKSSDTDTHLVNLGYTGLPAKLTAYSYLIDNDGAADSSTFGASASGKLPVGEDMKALYKVEFAQMGDYADNDSGDSANYYLVELGATIKKATVKLGYEVLGGDGTTSFQTPLATKHKFNGWADKFLSTPKDGLVDAYVTASGNVAGVKLLATYHMFSSDEGGDDYGSELDLLAVKKFGKIYSAGVKYAAYMEGDDLKNNDTNKLWLWGGITF